jgi:hypothetical protein
MYASLLSHWIYVWTPTLLFEVFANDNFTTIKKSDFMHLGVFPVLPFATFVHIKI